MTDWLRWSSRRRADRRPCEAALPGRPFRAPEIRRSTALFPSLHMRLAFRLTREGARMPRFAVALACLLAGLLPARAPAQRPLKVYISVDMEGIAGVVTSDQLSPTGFEYERARQFMTGEALAAIAGAR